MNDINKTLKHLRKKLKPCPICGDAWLYISDGDYYSGYESKGYKVSCMCHYAWNVVPWCNTKEEAIKRWNREARLRRRMK